MNKKDVSKDIKIFILCIIINFSGKLLAEQLNLPLWLDTIGTLLAAYVAGPVCGAIIGGTLNIMYFPMQPRSFSYLLINVLVGVIAGIGVRKGMLNKPFPAFSLSMLLSVVSSICSLPMNIMYFEGYTGNLWGDSTINYLLERGFNIVLCQLLGEFFVDLLDKLVSVFAIYFLVKLVRNQKKLNNTRFLSFIKKALAFFSALAVFTGILFSYSEIVNASHSDEYSMAPEKESSDFSSYVQTIYNGSNGIPGSEVNDIEQTRDGIIWIGTYGGLYQFDGNNFILMNNFDSVKNVTCLFTDEEGRLWIGTNDNGISICSDNQLVNVLNKNGGLSNDSVRAIAKNSNGYYYVSTVDELNIVELCDGIHTKYVLDSLKNVVSISCDNKGYVACVTANGSLSLLNNEKIKTTFEGSVKKNYTCAYFNNNILYAGTSAQTIEVYELLGDSLNYVETIECPGLDNINDILIKDNEIMVCSDSGIGYISADGIFNNINTPNFTSSIDNIIVDYQGNFWFTSSRLGLLKLSESVFREVSSNIGLENSVVNAIMYWNEEFYYGTDSGLIVSDKSQKNNISNKYTELLKGVRIRSLTTDSNNHLWIATYGLGAIEVIDENNIIIHNTSTGLSSDRVRHILILNDGRIACATVDGVSIINKDKSVVKIGTNEGLTNPFVLCLYEKDGCLYAGTDGGGVNIIKDDKVIGTLQKTNNLSSDIILRITRPSNTSGLLFITGTGIDYYTENGELRNLTSFPFYNNFDIKFPGDGNAWVIGSAGIFIINENKLLNNEVEDYILLDSKKGLRQRFVANSWNYTDSDCNLYLCGDSGISIINMDNYDKQRTSYRFALKTIAIDGVLVNIDKESDAVIGRNAVKIELFPKIVNYSVNDPYVGVWLEGFDKEPMICQQSELESLVYTNLSSGKYIFHLAIYDSNKERILEEVTYSFVKEKEFYDNWWFILYIFLMFAIIIIYFTFAVIGSHITKTIQLQKQEYENLKLKQKANEIAAASEAKDKFLALMSHDIRTPINAILGINEMIIRESKDKAIYGYAKDIKGAGNTLLSLVNSILDFSKIEEGKMEIIPVEYETKVVLHNLINGVKSRAENKNLEFITNIDSHLPAKMYGDDVRITEVISNLLTNAVKYTEKGFISLTIKELSRTDDNLRLFVEVKDSGIGIKEEDMDKLFESFQRLDEKRNRNIEGSGLGMSIVSNLLRLMDSSLNVESVYGEGSTFSFEIEQKVMSDKSIGRFEVNDVSDKDAKEEEHVYAPSADIMVVDDNGMNLRVIHGLLKINGISPVLLNSGQQAIDMANKKHFDIIFLDHMMPDMDGIETLHILKSQNIIDSTTKVIILTANAIIGAKEQYLNSGFDDYLSKPIDVKLLEEKLINYLPSDKVSMKTVEIAHFFDDAAEKNIDNQTVNPAVNDDNMPAINRYCPEIDLEKGLEFCVNSMEFYITVLKEFVKGDKSEKLDDCFSNKDYDNYRITIHSVKSNSMSIGATEFSEKAKALEHACTNKEYDYIVNNHDSFIKEYKSLITRLNDYLNNEEG